MYNYRSRANEITAAVWMIGLGILFWTNYWFPGILFVTGAGLLVQGLAEGRGWYASQGALWMFGLGIVFAMGFNVATLFILIGCSMLFSAIVKPPFLAKKPPVDNYLD